MRNLLSAAGTCLLAFVAVAVMGCDESITHPDQLQEFSSTAAAHKSFDGENATSVNGGGHIRDGDYDVSFAGEIQELSESSPYGSGEWVVQFHSVSVASVSGGTFEATGVEEVNLYDGDSDSCEAAMNMRLSGTFNGEAGWEIMFRLGDAGHTTDKDLEDTARVELSDPSGAKVYDTSEGDFADESDCVGINRSKLDAGNLKMKV